jgi:Ca-activated chloride channel family protein
MAHDGLKKSHGSIKHMVVFSDGDPTSPTDKQVQSIIDDKITISTVMIGGHVAPDTMTRIAQIGRGRFYDVRSPNQLPQIFIKEAAVILKSAIFEEPFKPQIAANTELIRGITAAEIPPLLGYVATSIKPRAETPILSEKGDPVLAHWQYGLGRAVAFTSDAKPKWAQQWLPWPKYRQFWSQVAQWSLRKIESADFNTDVTVDRGIGTIAVEALDANGNFRNFLNLEAVVVSPKGERVSVPLEQTGPGRYDAKFPTKEVGAYLINLLEKKDGKLVGSQVLGASVNYSPEFLAAEPNFNLLRRISEIGSGRMLDIQNPAFNPFEFDRKKTFQPNDLWEWLLRLAILLFPIDVGIRRIQLDRAEWEKFLSIIRAKIFFWQTKPRPIEAEESLDALLARRAEVRAKTTSAEPIADLFRPASAPVLEEPVANQTSQSAPPAPEQKPKQEKEPVGTTSRLLEAKRRAQKRQ